jgi:Protein of unknown function (DUF4238)
MNVPRKHHYIPQFYLRKWAGPDGRVLCYKRVPTGAVVADWVTPKSTGFEKDLYTLEHLPEDIRQAIEKEVTADVDNRAATAMQKMIAAKSADTLTADDRLGWAQFVVSLPIRNPDAVTDIKETSTKSGMEMAYKEVKRKFPDWAGGGDFRTEFEESVNEDPLTKFLSDNYGLIVISELMLNPQFQKIILDMHWWVVDFTKAGLSLITCDRPYMVFRTIRHPRGLIYLPLAPNLAFYASPDPNKGRQLRAQKAKLVVKEMNRWQAALAARFIYAADAEHTAFVENRLWTA